MGKARKGKCDTCGRENVTFAMLGECHTCYRRRKYPEQYVNHPAEVEVEAEPVMPYDEECTAPPTLAELERCADEFVAKMIEEDRDQGPGTGDQERPVNPLLPAERDDLFRVVFPLEESVNLMAREVRPEHVVELVRLALTGRLTWV